MTETAASSARPWLLRLIAARPRLFSCAAIGVATLLLLPESAAQQPIARLLVGWNVGVFLYLLLAAHMMFWSPHERMRRRALQQDEGRMVILALVVAAALMSLGAIVAELAVVRDMRGALRYGHIALTVLTIVSSWAFTQVMFALHYAHDYYASEPGRAAVPGRPCAGLRRLSLFFLRHRHVGPDRRRQYRRPRNAANGAGALRAGVLLQHHAARAVDQYRVRVVLTRRIAQ